MASAADRTIYLHIGTPKTGTSALQFGLYTAREELRSHGILYPEGLIASPDDPKHQPLFNAIRSGNSRALASACDLIRSELSDDLHSVILSSEGFYHHILEFHEGSWRLIQELARCCSLNIIVYLRPQAEYLESLYRQYVKNPRGVNESYYGSAMTIQKLMDRPRVRQNLDYHGSLMQWASVVGNDRILVRRYAPDVVDDFLSLLGVTLVRTGPRPRRNPSLTREMAELLRSVNATFDNRQRGSLIAEMEKALKLDPGRADTTILSPAEGRALMDRYRECNRRVAKHWLGEDDLFPGYDVRDPASWMPVHIDRAKLLAAWNSRTAPEERPSNNSPSIPMESRRDANG
jgi:hypothetical protein